LDDVVRVAQGAEHAIGDGAQVGPMPFELLRLQVDRVHSYILPSASVIEVTNGGGRM
jgi:hypothetical protein